MIRRSREIDEEGEEGLQGLEVDISDLEWLDDKEKEVFGELNDKLSELKDADQKTQDLISPPENTAENSAEPTEMSNKETSVSSWI